jgi:hypothetical protein
MMNKIEILIVLLVFGVSGLFFFQGFHSVDTAANMYRFGVVTDLGVFGTTHTPDEIYLHGIAGMFIGWFASFFTALWCVFRRLSK